MERLEVERSVWIDAPRERVWQAITDPAQLEHWYAAGCPWEIPALEPGTLVKFYNTPDDVLLATIEAVEPPREFRLRWQPDPQFPNTRLVMSLIMEEEAGGTRATVLESGYETMPEAAARDLAAQTGEGYHLSMAELKAFVEGSTA